jgi:hypothetical protein
LFFCPDDEIYAGYECYGLWGEFERSNLLEESGEDWTKTHSRFGKTSEAAKAQDERGGIEGETLGSLQDFSCKEFLNK